MQILTVSPDRYVDRSNLLEQMHWLRAAVFRERLECDFTITKAGERDEYDDLDPTCILAATDDERVIGCARLLPEQARPCWNGLSRSCWQPVRSAPLRG